VVKKFKHRRSGRKWPAWAVAAVVLVAAAIVGSIIVLNGSYGMNLRAVSGDTNQKVFVVSQGETVNQVATSLHTQGLVRQAWAFERYVGLMNLGSKLQAGTYRFSPSESATQIADAIASGKVAIDLITILPGQRLDQVRDDFIKAKFDPASVDAALQPAQYANIPALADKPSDASLEGFLYPDSYQKDATTDPKSIIRASLEEMSTHLTPTIRQAFAAHGLSVYQAVTMASVIEKEVSNSGDRTQVAQVFYKRLAADTPLQSDVTAFYGAILAGKKPSVSYSSPYNTYQVKGLPKGPISNVTDSSLQAVAAPADTDWLYFVAGDDGHTYFSKTLAEHQALTQEHCKKLCSN
jgi:UPF0755 protein